MVADETARFWDRHFNNQTLPEGGLVSTTRLLTRALDFFGDVRGKKILDIGCGLGDLSIPLARLGGEVTAIDASEVAINKLERFCRSADLPIRAIAGNAMKIDDLGRFDFVVGSMILHHLEPFDQFADKLSAVLKDGGKAFFFENNSASQILVWFRKYVVGKLWIPKHGDNDEFPLTPQEVDALRATLDVIQEFPELVLIRLISVYIFRGRLYKYFKHIDDLLFNHNLFVKYSYHQYLLMRKL